MKFSFLAFVLVVGCASAAPKPEDPNPTREISIQQGREPDNSGRMINTNTVEAQTCEGSTADGECKATSKVEVRR